MATAKIVSFFFFLKQTIYREREQLYPFSPLLGNVIEVDSLTLLKKSTAPYQLKKKMRVRREEPKPIKFEDI